MNKVKDHFKQKEEQENSEKGKEGGFWIYFTVFYFIRCG